MNSSSFSLNVNPDWVPPFQVKKLYMRSCHLGPSFLAWLQSQNYLQQLDSSNGSISGPIPNWFWNIAFDLRQLKLSDNQIQGQLPNSFYFSTAHVHLNFSSNLFEGPIPCSIKGVSSLDLPRINFLTLSHWADLC